MESMDGIREATVILCHGVTWNPMAETGNTPEAFKCTQF